MRTSYALFVYSTNISIISNKLLNSTFDVVDIF